jgi:hypothetical protein
MRGMDVLRSKTPSLVRKEIWVFLLAYNLLRTLMWSAGIQGGVHPSYLSIQGTRQHFNNFIHKFLNISDQQSSIFYQTLLKILIHHMYHNVLVAASQELESAAQKPTL